MEGGTGELVREGKGRRDLEKGEVRAFEGVMRGRSFHGMEREKGEGECEGVSERDRQQCDG